MQGLAMGALPFPPPVGGATEQRNGRATWGLEQVVFREHQAALVVRSHDSAVQEPLSPAFIGLPKGRGCVGTAN